MIVVKKERYAMRNRNAKRNILILINIYISQRLHSLLIKMIRYYSEHFDIAEQLMNKNTALIRKISRDVWGLIFFIFKI